MRIATSSMKHHDQSSPGSSERMSGCVVARAWAVACGSASRRSSRRGRTRGRCADAARGRRSRGSPRSHRPLGQSRDVDRGRGACRWACDGTPQALGEWKPDVEDGPARLGFDGQRRRRGGRRRCGRAVASPRPVPLPISLVVKNESKTRVADLRGDARPVVGDVDRRAARRPRAW